MKTQRTVLKVVVMAKAILEFGSDSATLSNLEDAVEQYDEAPELPRVVCLCGSTRFYDEFQKANLRETLRGNIVLTIGCDTKADGTLLSEGQITAAQKERLDELHKRKIDLADEVYVLNKGGYVGESTRSEIQYALSTGKPIRWLEPIDFRTV